MDARNSHRAAARHFRVSPRFVNNLMLLAAATASLAARRQGHGKGKGKLAAHAGFVRGRLAANGELTLDALCVELEARGVSLHRSSVCRLVARLRLAYRKRRFRRSNSSGPASPRHAASGRSGASASSTSPWRASSLSARHPQTQSRPSAWAASPRLDVGRISDVRGPPLGQLGAVAPRWSRRCWSLKDAGGRAPTPESGVRLRLSVRRSPRDRARPWRRSPP